MQLGEHRRCGVDHVDAVSRDRLDQRLGVALDVVVDDVHRVAVEQGDQRLPCGVEGERPGVRHAQRVAQACRRRPQDGHRVVFGVRQQRLMSPDDTLGPACRTGSEDHIRRLAGTGGYGSEAVGRLGCGVRHQRIVDDDRGTALVEDVGDPVGRHRGVQRHDHSPGLEHTEHRDHVLAGCAKG